MAIRSGLGAADDDGPSGKGHFELEAYDSRRGGVLIVKSFRKPDAVESVDLTSMEGKLRALDQPRVDRR